MSLNTDDLQRMRDAIAKGWDFTTCYVDFEAAIIELLDDALDGDDSAARDVYECFPSTDKLQDVIDELDTFDCEEGNEADFVESIVTKLTEIKETRDEAGKEALDMVEAVEG